RLEFRDRQNGMRRLAVLEEGHAALFDMHNKSEPRIRHLRVGRGVDLPLRLADKRIQSYYERCGKFLEARSRQRLPTCTQAQSFSRARYRFVIVGRSKLADGQLRVQRNTEVLAESGQHPHQRFVIERYLSSSILPVLHPSCGKRLARLQTQKQFPFLTSLRSCSFLFIRAAGVLANGCRNCAVLNLRSLRSLRRKVWLPHSKKAGRPSSR